MTDEPELTVYEPRRGWAVLNLRELWKYRELMFFLAVRDVKVRYRQAVLGIAWVVIQPLVTMVVFTFIFNRALGVSGIPGVPYAVFSITGLVLWTYFSSALSRSTGALVGQASLLTKVYFPRLVLPFSSMITGLVDVLIGLVIIAVVMAIFAIVPGWQLALFPLFILMALLTALGMGLWLGPLNVLYRDVGSVMPYLVQLMMFLSAVILDPVEQFVGHNTLITICYLNPITGAIAGFRWSLLGGEFHAQYFGYSLAVVAVLLITGLFFFKRMERQFADVV